MNINQASLDAIRVGFQSNFQGGLDGVETEYGRIATTVPSSTKSNKFGWLGKIPGMREWIGERQIRGIAEHSYAIENRSYELTEAVDRNDIEDDNLGIYAPLMTAMGEAVGALPDELVFTALANGFTELCYDGQNFFDTDHPVLDAKGNPQSVSNTAGGAGTAWFVLDLTKPLKPIIFQERQAPQFVSKDNPADERVFMNRQFVYGADRRCSVGYGFWQMAYASRQTLNGDNYKAARNAMLTMKTDYGRPLPRRRLTLVVPQSLELEAMELLNSERDANGATNVYRNTADLFVANWLS